MSASPAKLPDRLTVVSYAVNGAGLGHISRLIAVNHWMRRYALHAGVKLQQWFITTSEADTMLFHEGFAGFKLPSKTIVGEAGVDKITYIALAKQWVWHTISSLRPDLLLVDTFPGGSFGELPAILDICQRKVLILRPVKEHFAKAASYKSLVGLYDRVVVPEYKRSDNDLAASLHLPPSLFTYSGPVMRPERFAMYDAATAKQKLGAPSNSHTDAPETSCVLISGGGGGDREAAILFERMFIFATQLAQKNTIFVFAAGALYRGPSYRSSNVVWWTGQDLPLHMQAFDAAVVAAGFNTAHELMFAGIPTVFVPQEKIADDQYARAQHLAKDQAACVASLQSIPEDGDSPESLLTVYLQNADLRDAARKAAQQRVPQNCARHAAAAVLSTVLPKYAVHSAVSAIDDDLLADLLRANADCADAINVAEALQGALQGESKDRSALDLDAAALLISEGAQLQCPPATLVRLASAAARSLRFAKTSPAELVDTLIHILEHPLVANQANAILLLLQSLGNARWDMLASWQRDVLRFFDDVMSLHCDIFAAIRAATELQHILGDGYDAALLRRAVEKLREKMSDRINELTLTPPSMHTQEEKR